MDAVPSTWNDIYKSEMEQHGKFGHNLGQIHKTAIMIRVEICYTACNLGNHMWCLLFLYINISKDVLNSLIVTPTNLFYPFNSYGGSNVIRLTWSVNQVEDYTTQNCLECHQYADHARTINRRRLVS